MKTKPAVAIVAMSGVFPEAKGANAFWHNILHKVDTTKVVSKDRWIAAPDWVYSNELSPDKAYSLRACLVDDFNFSQVQNLDLDSELILELDLLYQWVLFAAQDAFHRCQINNIDRQRVDVILAAIALPTEATSRLSQQMLEAQLVPEFDIIRSKTVSQAQALSNRVCSLPAAIVAKALGLGGGTLTLDAACASSLYAVKLACDALQDYRTDAVITGGVSRPDCLYTQIGFSQLRALSASGRCAPFDQSADGLVVGEGAGILVLKRLDDALAHNDTIYGVIRGIGLSNDMRGNLLAPESAGQLRAMRAAYELANWQPWDVDFIECHGAGTPVGDATELHSLCALWGDDNWQVGQCAIGSVKSMIGHLLTAAGAAGMIKTLLSMHHKMLPPSLKFEKPGQDSPLPNSPFHVQTEPASWHQRDDHTPRRAAVSAFGFGGINAHLLLEQWLPQKKRPLFNGSAAAGVRYPEFRWEESGTAQKDCKLKISDKVSLSCQERRNEGKKTRQQDDAIAVVGIDVCIGSIANLKAFFNTILEGRSVLTKASDKRWKTVKALRNFLDRDLPLGAFMDEVTLQIGQFQIPPSEIPDILPQQLLMLKTAAGAMRDAGLPLREAREHMGALIGISFDYEATNFHLRWALPRLTRQWRDQYCPAMDDTQLAKWIDASLDGCGPPLTATRTLGALGGIVASRIAREFRFGGPSFVVSAEEVSGLRALEISMRMLQDYQADAMLVGAVDLNCDERNLVSLFARLSLSKTNQIRPFDQNANGTLPGEGAVALVLKRLSNAKADNDRIYAVIKGVGAAASSGIDQNQISDSAYIASLKRAFGDARISPAHISLMETHGSGTPEEDDLETRALHHFFANENHTSAHPVAIGALKPLIGHTGAVAGLASVVKTILSLYHEIIPPLPNYSSPRSEQWQQGLFYMPHHAGYWLRNRVDGPRTACVGAMTADGNCMHLVLQESDHHNIRTKYRSRAGSFSYGLFLIHGQNTEDLLAGLDQVRHMARQSNSTQPPIEIARKWHLQTRNPKSTSPPTLAIVAESTAALLTYLKDAHQAVEKGTSLQMSGQGGVCYLPHYKDLNGQITFVYPGSGNHYVGMGRDLGLHYPAVLHAMDQATNQLQDQMLPQYYMPWRIDWTDGWQERAYQTLVADPRYTIFGQMMFGDLMTNLLQQFNIHPHTAIGYSLGESTALFALGAWSDRGQMLKRLQESDLFKTQLTGSYESLRQAWKIPTDQPLQWQVAVVNMPADQVEALLMDLPHVRRLIVNTPKACVIGGLKNQVQAVIKKLGCHALFLDSVVSVHCDAVQPVAQAYKDLHRFVVTPVPNMRFYSCAWGSCYDLSEENCAQSILDQALHGFHFPRTIEQAYSDGIRIFVEIGPHNSCTRMINDILGSKPHLAINANKRDETECLSVIKCLGTLAATGLPVNLDALYDNTLVDKAVDANNTTQIIRVPIGGHSLSLNLPQTMQQSAVKLAGASSSPSSETPMETPAPNLTAAPMQSALPKLQGLDLQKIFDQINANTKATAQIHDRFLDFSQDMTTQFGQAFELQNQLLQQLASNSRQSFHNAPEAYDSQPVAPSPALPAVVFNRDQCMEFAIGSVGKMLGAQYAVVDTYKVRVRLPDKPLMLVDRILLVEGEKLSLNSGRVVTEHDVLPNAWYLDGNRTPVCISVEAGQADLFLCSYLGIDHQVKGKRTYRLLDATVHFHRGLPRPGETIRYDIHIDKFIRQGEVYLFRFRFEGYIGEERLITMMDGCAGFFTEQEVCDSGGIIFTDNDRAAGAQINGAPFEYLMPLVNETYDDDQIEALRSGDAGTCFGPAFSTIILPPALRLPSGRMRLIHRVVTMEPFGGRFGKGYIKAEADIHPHDWFLTCHFVDDMVMPGTLMYECCAHTLRVLLLRLGWLTDKNDVCYEPIQGVPCRFRCRGPVTSQTRHAHYAVEIKEIGYHPEPYVVTDAHVYADGDYIVFFKDMTMQITGVTQEAIQVFWQNRSQQNTQTVRSAPLFTQEHILEFAMGSPSKAFGEPYRAFDNDRFIARLPKPPFGFINRITSIEPDPWVLKPNGWVEAQYDVSASDWYFAADRSGIMPFCVLLEIALQPCGWLAAYAGSALKSNKDLKFRNLGGQAEIHANIQPLEQTLTTRTRMTKISDTADMIIEHFDFQVLIDDQVIFNGNTYFGFFTTQALADQKGLRDAANTVYQPNDGSISLDGRQPFRDDPPFIPQDEQIEEIFKPQGLLIPSKALRMIDGIAVYHPNGGAQGLGVVRGYKKIDPEEWFFKAHFYQDPVWPGSLGIESFLQLIKYAAMQRWPKKIPTHGFELVCNQSHQWIYRGQVIPSNREVIVDAVITHIEDGDEPVILANGWLQVDGLYIYKMEGFGLRLKRQ